MRAFISVEQAVDLDGLRLVLTRNVPNPWGEAAKGMFFVKKIPFTPVAMESGELNEPLRRWTGQTSAPVAVMDQEPPCIHWSNIIMLAERLAPEPALVPADEADRMVMFGMIHELAGEDGFAWNRRMLAMAGWSDTGAAVIAGSQGDVVQRMKTKYRFRPEAAAVATARMRAILRLVGDRLRDQQRAGSRYFIGQQLTALDIYAATFAAMIVPLPQEHCKMDDVVRAGYRLTVESVLEVVDPILLTHRDYIYEHYLELPVWL